MIWRSAGGDEWDEGDDDPLSGHPEGYAQVFPNMESLDLDEVARRSRQGFMDAARELIRRAEAGGSHVEPLAQKRPVNNEGLIREAAEAGAVCSECGGLHVLASIDSAIRVLAETEGHENAAPWCECESCAFCGPLVKAVHTIQNAENERTDITGLPDRAQESLDNTEEQ